MGMPSWCLCMSLSVRFVSTELDGFDDAMFGEGRATFLVEAAGQF